MGPKAEKFWLGELVSGKVRARRQAQVVVLL